MRPTKRFCGSTSWVEQRKKYAISGGQSIRFEFHPLSIVQNPENQHHWGEYLFAYMHARAHKTTTFPGRKLLVLDLDETLIHGNPEAEEGDFLAAGIPVFIRLGARKFLAQMAKIFDLAVWTSASEDYASDIVQAIFPAPDQLRFLWSRERCVRRINPETRKLEFIKDLKKLRRQGWNLAHVIVVDDSPEKLARNYGNLVRVPPFTGGQDDILGPLASFLEELYAKPDVRVIEKRGWLQKLLSRQIKRSLE